MWKQWVNVLLGILVIVVAYTGPQTTWLVVLGVLVALLALWAALEKRQ